ncbi:MAG: DMT family transporter [Patescibacteria group bacterium]|jgi:drug/metabolite transporter (DMT)-like permease
MTLPILFAFGAMLGWGIGDFLIQRTVRKIGAVGTLLWITLFSSLALLPFVFNDISSLTSRQIINLVILGIAGFASGFVHMKALRVGKLSVVEIILSVELPLTILLGIIFFAERLNLMQVILIIILFIGIILVSVDFTKISKKDFLEKGSLLALLSSALVALVNFLTATQAKEISPIMALWLPWLACGLFSGGYIISREKLSPFLKTCRINWKLILAMVIVDTAAWVFYVFAVAEKELSIIVAITESFVVIALILGVVFNKEKVNKIQYFGAGLAIACSLLIGLISK